MRTIFPLAVVLALGLSAAFFAGSGFNAIVTGEHNTEQIQNNVSHAANESAVDEGAVEGSRSSGDGSIVGLVIGGTRSIATFTGMIILLPLTLQNLGFPTWFAVPVGSIAEILLGIGLVQFVTGRILK